MSDNNLVTDEVKKTITKLTPIFREVFDDDDLEIIYSTSAQDVVGWDSLNHIRLVVTIEKTLNIRFTTDEISNLKNVGEMAQLIIMKQA
jgi:acyl carrier protein